MSDKPDDIPQDIWEAAQAAFERQLNEWSTSEAVARAILAERERNATVTLEFGGGQPTAMQLGIAARIRRGSA